MKYVLVTHVPTYAGQSGGVVRLTESFRDDLLAEAGALRQAGFDLTLATPRFATPDAKTLGRERFVDVRLADHGVADAPLPAYRTMRQFLAARSKLQAAIESAVATADVVQAGAGGHPMALGQFAWPLVPAGRAKRVFVFAGDPLPGRQKAVVSGHNPAKRLGKAVALRAFGAFCRQAIGEADLVFAHDPAVARRFSREWNDRCHTFAVSPVGDGDLIGTYLLARKRRHLDDAAHAVRLVTVAVPGPTGGLDHVLKAVAKAKRLGAKVTLAVVPTPGGPTLSDLRNDSGLGESLAIVSGPATAMFDDADLAVAAPLVPGEIATIFAAAARGMPMLTYGAGVADAALAAAGGAAVVERGHADALAQAILDLCRDRNRLATMAESARGWAAGVTRDATHRTRAALVRDAVGG